MTIDEVIKRIKEKMACDYNISGCDTCNISSCEDRDIVNQIAECLEELKVLRAYKEKMEMQYLDDISNPLEPLKLTSALESELFKYNYRKEHKPQDINILDYTIMYALKHCLKEQLEDHPSKESED